MAVNGGRLAVGIGTGAAGGATTGAMFGPWGAAIGGVIGGGAGALSELLSSSDEAKKRKQARERLMQQQRESKDEEYEQLMAGLTGMSNNPMYRVMQFDPYNEREAGQKADEYLEGAMPEQQPNYGQLVNSLGSLGSTVGGLARQGDAQARLDELIQSRRTQQTGNPWQGYADTQQDDTLEKLLEKARGEAWDRTGGW